MQKISYYFHALVIKNPYLTVLIFVSFIALALFPDFLFAHEQWFLTPQEFNKWYAHPQPILFTHWTATKIAIYSFSLIFLVAWISLNRTGARELFPDLQVRLASYGDYASVILRYSTAIMLLMAAFGMNPRIEILSFTVPTFVAPDLQLTLLSPFWSWLKWWEIIIALALILGIYVRLTAILFLLTSLLAIYLFGFYILLPYLGFIIGICLYLLLQGPGLYYIPLPVPQSFQKLINWLQDQPRDRAQFLLRLTAGLNFIYNGIEYKFLHPNLDITILSTNHVFTFGMSVETFVLCMAIVETLAGVLLIAGVLLRPMSLFLLACFIFLGLFIDESPLAHIMFYGVLITFYLNGAGQWRRPIAKDKPTHIVILGGTLAGIQCAMKLENLIGQVSNVQLTLVNEDNYFQLQPLLAEVIDGSVQPNNIVNPIRRICHKTHFIQGEIKCIDSKAQQVEIIMLSGEKRSLPYDQLVLAPDKVADFANIPGLLEHSFPIMNIGDALYLRKRVLECLEQAAQIKDKKEKQKLLSFAIVGGDIRSSCAAAEIKSLVNSALAYYPTIEKDDITITLLEHHQSILSAFDATIAKAAHRNLTKLGIRIKTNIKIDKVTPKYILCSPKDKLYVSTIVCGLSKFSPLLDFLPTQTPEGRAIVNAYLQPCGINNIFIAGTHAAFDNNAYQTLRVAKMGRIAAYNAWANSQGYRLQAWRQKPPHIYIVPLGRYASLVKIYGFTFSGLIAWLLARYSCLLTLPTLERNLRILIDWLLDIPFKQDIVTISPQLTKKFARAHYEAGDVIIHQNETSECAYLLLSGEVSVLKTVNGVIKEVAKLQKGELFGELASISKTERTTTIKCLTSTDVLILPQDQFLKLLSGSRESEC